MVMGHVGLLNFSILIVEHIVVVQLNYVLQHDRLERISLFVNIHISTIS